MSSSAVVAAGPSSSSFSVVAFTRRTNIVGSPVSKQQRISFHGLSIEDAKKSISTNLIKRATTTSTSSSSSSRGLEISAKTAGASKNIEVEVDKPLGLTLGQKPGGGVVITAVDGGGNAAKAGLKSGDQVIYTSSFFGDELWPADKLGFTKTAIQAKPDSIYFVVSRGGPNVDVKRLPKRPAPPRFGVKLTDAQKESHPFFFLPSSSSSVFFFFNQWLIPFFLSFFRPEQHIYVLIADTYIRYRNPLMNRQVVTVLYYNHTISINIFFFYIYMLFSFLGGEQSDGYACPQCLAPKKRFASYDVKTGKAIGGGLPPIGVIIGLLLGISGVGALLLYGLQ